MFGKKKKEPQQTSLPEEVQATTPSTESQEETSVSESPAVPEEPATTEPPVPGWEEAVKYLSQSDAVTTDIQAIMDKHTDHALKIVENEGQYEAFLIHKSSLPTNQTLLTLRSLLPLEAGTHEYGMHKLVRGSYEEVLAALS